MHPDHPTSLPRLKETGLLGVVLVLGLLLSTFGGSLTITSRETGQTRTVNKFLRADNLDKLAKNTSFFAIMAVGVTFVIISGGIDLSIGSTYCLTAVCGAMFLHHFGPQGHTAEASAAWVVPAAILLCLAIGTLAGLLNGLGVVLLGVHPFVITLGTMAIYRGIAFVMTKAQSYTHFPPQFTDGLIRFEVGRNLYPIPMLIMVIVTCVAAAYLRYTTGGRQVFAIGGNEQAARFSGISVGRVKLRVYAFCGLTAGIAAVIMLGYYGSASSDAGKGYELDVIAAAVVGGASLSGGRGTALGALLGALIIQIIANGIIILEVDQNYSQIIIGAVIVLAVVLDRINTALRERRHAGSAHRLLAVERKSLRGTESGNEPAGTTKGE
ncbi:MAG TPA: ABC transporter permease [Phycisphaerae bacterium]|nr:ABC transporter permease [Phycisphaerae bacterium]HRY69452.1 ABC transporter permease [Phycisphaerae bacterium]HSA26319.1 ABC transporter permease [Phycisphaerae bacterium]